MTPALFEFSKETFDWLCRYHYEMDNYGCTGVSLQELPADFPTEILGFELTPEKQRFLIQYMQLDIGKSGEKCYYIFLYDKLPAICLCTYAKDFTELAPDRFLLADEVRSKLSPSITTAHDTLNVKATRTVIPYPLPTRSPRRWSG